MNRRFAELMNRLARFAGNARRNPSADTEEIIALLVSVATITLHAVQTNNNADRALRVFETELESVNA